MRVAFRSALALFVLAIVVVPPYLWFRANYSHNKRLRVVEAGVLYRSGQLTADGFREAIAKLGIRTVVNCQNEFPDPGLPRSYWSRATIAETALCRELGVRYVHLDPDLAPNRTDPAARPRVIDEFLAILDDPAAHPVLLHCKAGLHRTGCLVAVYRQEYDGWGPFAALQELKANGFGDVAATAANDYVQQYLLNYRPREMADRRLQIPDFANRDRTAKATRAIALPDRSTNPQSP